VPQDAAVATRRRRLRRALEVTGVARRTKLLSVLREVGVVGGGEATREGAEAFHTALEELGTTFIKLGQLLSSRPDLLPDVYVQELGRLVDEVAPVPFEQIERVIEEALGSEVFTRIDPEPLAAGSIAQIHAALLKDGREVVVKVRRPGIVDEVALDLDLLRRTAELVEGHSETARLLQLRALSDELEAHLRAELDLVEEANNTELIGRLVADFELLHVPRVIHPYVREEVLVLERLHGVKVEPNLDVEPGQAEALSRQLFGAYVRQIATEGLYHADPHRGNVLLMPDGRLALLDFGLLGRLDDDTRRTIALLLLAIAQNRADDVAALILEVSLTDLRSDAPGFVHEVRRKLPRYHWRPLSSIRTGEALADLMRIAVTHHIALPTSFALVGKTLAQADSIARMLDPHLDPVELLEEEAMGLMVAEGERSMQPNRLYGYLFTQLAPAARLPRRVTQLVERLETGTLKVGVAPTDLEELERLVRSLANRLGAALIIVGLLVSSALMAQVDDTVSLVGYVISGVLALYLFWKIVRTPGDL
jgi:ubiquinone biosynthesis protein